MTTLAKRKLDLTLTTKSKKKKYSENEAQQERDYRLAVSLQPRECTICLEELDADFFHTLQCEHSFCRDCLGGLLSTKMADPNKPIECPQVGCHRQILVTEMEMLVDNALVEKYTEKSLQSFISVNNDAYSCCPTPDCTYVFFFVHGDTDFQCPLCEKRHCLKCNVEYHEGATCSEYQKWSLLNGQSDDLFGTLVEKKKMKQCARCRNWVEKADGCPHITCRCGFEFCYRCGQKWPHSKCPADQQKRQKKLSRKR